MKKISLSLIVFVGIAFCLINSGESAEDEKRTISVSSEGTLQRYPDKARVSYRISADHSEPAQAYEELLEKVKEFEVAIYELGKGHKFEIQKSGVLLTSGSGGYASQRSGNIVFSSVTDYSFIFDIESPETYESDYRSILRFIGALKNQNFIPEFQESTLSIYSSPRVYIAYYISDLDSMKDELVELAKKNNLQEARKAASMIDLNPDRLQIDGHNLNTDRITLNIGDKQGMAIRNITGVSEYSQIDVSITLHLTYKIERGVFQ